jgi:perosamine synthetase
MRIGRTLPPAATPIDFRAVVSGIRGVFRGSKELERFRSEVIEHFGVKHCFLVSSGKAALALILRALKEVSPDRDEVILPAFTCYSVPASVIREGLRIRLCDQRPDNFDFDFSQLSAMLAKSPPHQAEACCSESSRDSRGDGAPSPRSSSKVLAVVPTHLFGYPSDVARLRTLMRDSGIAIIEDAAQAMGETMEGRRLGTMGDIGFFSLARGKAFSVVEGGIIITNRDNIAEALNRMVEGLPSYGFLSRLKLVFDAVALMLLLHPWLFWVPRSLPFLRLGETLFETDFHILKMSSFQAGLARNWRRKIEKLRDVRMANVKRWISVLEGIQIDGSSFLRSYSQGLLRFPLLLGDDKKREALLQESARLGLGIMPVYPTSIDAIPELRGMLADATFPVAESYPRKLVTLPTHGYLTETDVADIGGLVSRVSGRTCLEGYDERLSGSSGS